MLPGDNKERCYICGRYGATELHHCLHGIRRKHADKYGLTVHLCPGCHRKLHDTGENDKALEQIAQEYLEKQYGHDKWMEVFGKDFKEDE